MFLQYIYSIFLCKLDHFSAMGKIVCCNEMVCLAYKKEWVNLLQKKFYKFAWNKPYKTLGENLLSFYKLDHFMIVQQFPHCIETV